MSLTWHQASRLETIPPSDSADNTQHEPKEVCHTQPAQCIITPTHHMLRWVRGAASACADPSESSVVKDERTSPCMWSCRKTPLSCNRLQKSQLHTWLHAVTGASNATLIVSVSFLRTACLFESKLCLKRLRKGKWHQSRRRIICGPEGNNKKKEKRFDLSSSATINRRNMSKPNYSGTYHLADQDNMDSYLAALGKTPHATAVTY